MKIVYLKPKSTFPFLSSDSIFGAIVYGFSELFPNDLDGFIEDFRNKDNLPFLISSAFPYCINESEYIRFYPKPFTRFQSDDIKLSKKFKKIKFLEENIFLDLISGNINNEDLFNNFKEGKFIINEFNESFLVNPDNQSMDGAFFSKEISPHNVIDRVNSNSINIFYSEDYRFKNNKGLFFLVEFKDSRYEDKFFAVLKYLRDRGFGKDISSGKGHFNFEIDDFTLLDSLNQAQYFINLSRFIPNGNDIECIRKTEDEYNILYEIGDKRSRDSFGLRQKTRFFKEGSVFPNYPIKENISFCGSLVDTSSRSIEYGYSFNVPYNQGEL